MAISVTEILGTDSLSGSRLVINDNFNVEAVEKLKSSHAYHSFQIFSSIANLSKSLTAKDLISKSGFLKLNYFEQTRPEIQLEVFKSAKEWQQIDVKEDTDFKKGWISKKTQFPPTKLQIQKGPIF